MGYLPEALCNYLLRLGWSHNDIEIITKEDAVKIFTLNDINKSAARFDINKLNSLNAHYISQSDNIKLLHHLQIPNEMVKNRLIKAMDDLKIRATTIKELQEVADLYYKKKQPVDQKSLDIIAEHHLIVSQLIKTASSISNWNANDIKKAFEDLASENNLNAGKMMQILRAFVIGSFKSPGIYETLNILGQKEAIMRLKS